MAGGYENSRRFLNAFVGINRRWEDREEQAACPVYQLVDLATADPFIRNRPGTKGMVTSAMPLSMRGLTSPLQSRTSVVERLEQIRDLLHSPPTVGDAF